MKPVTINELANMAARAVEQGYGDYIVCVSDDEECNGYHEIYIHQFSLGGEITYLNQHTKMTETGKTLVLS